MNLQDQILKYLDGELTDQEAMELEKLIAENPEAREDKELYEKFIWAVRKQGETDLRKELDGYLEDYLNEKKPVSRSMKLGMSYVVGIAASVLLLIGAYFLLSEPVDTNQLFAQYYEPYPSLVSVRSSVPTVAGDSSDLKGPESMHGKQILSEAYSAYAVGDYQKAIELFRKKSPMSDTVAFYLSICHLSLGQLDEALAAMDHLADNSIFQQESTWYRGLIHLRKSDIDQSIYWLQQIPQDDFKSKEAQQLISKLKD